MTAPAMAPYSSNDHEPSLGGLPAAPLLAVDEVCIRFGALSVLERISFAVEEREFVSFLGPSGCGKSTLLKAIAGLREIAAGTIVRRDDGLRLGLMFQKPLLLPWRTVLDNVLLPIEIELGGNVVSCVHRQRAIDLLGMVHLQDFAAAYPHQLSGGMQQRAALARALMSDPDVLLLDEPFGALDELRRDALNQELTAIWRSRRSRLKTVVMVTHSVPEAVSMSDRVLVLGGRPASLLRSVDVGLAYPRETEGAAVQGIVREIRSVLRGHQ